jgi:hypothetical protein
MTKRGTDRNDFINFVKILPDKGTGDLSPKSEVVPLHTYVTILNESEADSVRQFPFVRLCEEIGPSEVDDGNSGFSAINRTLAPTVASKDSGEIPIPPISTIAVNDGLIPVSTEPSISPMAETTSVVSQEETLEVLLEDATVRVSKEVIRVDQSKLIKRVPKTVQAQHLMR